MTLDDLLRTVRAAAREVWPHLVPTGVTIHFAGEKDFASPLPAEGMPSKRQEVAQETPTRRPTDCAEAIFRLLYDASERLTGGQITDRLIAEHRDEPGFSGENIRATLTRLTRLKQLSNPKGTDDYGRGYGLPEWSDGATEE